MKAFNYLPATLSLARRAGKNIYTKLFFIIVVFLFSLFGATGVGAASKCYCDTEFKQDEIYHKLLSANPGKKIETCALTFSANTSDAIFFAPGEIVDREGIITQLLRLLLKQKNSLGCSEWYNVLVSLEQRGIVILFVEGNSPLPIDSLKKDNCGTFKIEYKIQNKTWFTGGTGSERVRHAYFEKDPDNKLNQVTRFKLFNCDFFDKEIKEKPPDAEEVVKDTEYKELVKSVEGLRQLSLTGGTSVEKIQNLIGKIIKYLLGFTGSLALAMFVGGGLMWMTARGNAERTAKALKMITWASLGVVVILASFVIVKFIFDLFK